MLRRHRQIRMQVHQMVDACLFGASFWLAYQLRASERFIELLGLDPFKDPFSTYVWFYLVLIITAPLVLESQGFYDRPLLGPRKPILWALVKGVVFATVGLIFVLYFFKLVPARSIPIWFGFISFGLVVAKEELLRWAYRSRYSQTKFRRRYILVGSASETTRLRAEMKAHPEADMEVLAQLDLNQTPLEKLVELLHEHSINGVILTARHTYFEQAEAVIKACEKEGVEAWLVADFFSTQISRTTFDDFYGRPVMVFRTAPETSWQSLAKQVVDYAGAFLLLLLLTFVIPLIPIVALLIKFTSPGPVMFRQQRAGLNGSPFTMYKFRTMVTNAEQLKHELAALNEMSGPVFKVTKDPRVTRIGRWLRKTSFDELPQLVNVLRGEMSLVGPRPLPVDEVKRFDDVAHRRRLSVKPGLTCLWQISGRNEISDFRDWVRLDLEYIDNWSLWLDLKIIVRTIPVVFLGVGAK